MNLANDVRAWVRTCLAMELRLHYYVMLVPGNGWETLYLGEPEPKSHDHEPSEPPCTVCGWGL